MDLSPFYAIDPCGYPGLSVTHLKDLDVTDSIDLVGDKLVRHLERVLV
jgi:lipoyl(octanoyl) transferase